MHPKSSPQKDRSEAEELETTIQACDSHGKVLVQVRLDLTSLQAEAEVNAGAAGDPIRLLADILAARLADEGFMHVQGKSRRDLESALSNAVIAGKWPAKLNVQVESMADSSRRMFKGESKSTEDLYVPSTNVGARVGEPPRSTAVGSNHPSTQGSPVSPDLFESHIRYPTNDARRIFENLVGLDVVKARLVKEAIVLTQPETLQRWSEAHHSSTIRALDAVRNGTPLFIFAGDVGTGKTALAESFGDAVSRRLKQPVNLLRMSVQTRGSGIVGDMTRQISRAFRAVEAEARRSGHVTILLLDEADALAESRETQQMHHEDRAGVNALIQGVDHLRGSGVPALIVFCSNRLESIDPAILRRAVDIIEFHRPDAVQRRAHLERLLGDLRFSETQWQKLVALTGPREGRSHGFTYSDISDRLIRNAILSAFPDHSLSFAVIEDVASRTVPTRPFGDMGKNTPENRASHP